MVDSIQCGLSYRQTDAVREPTPSAPPLHIPPSSIQTVGANNVPAVGPSTPHQSVHDNEERENKDRLKDFARVRIGPQPESSVTSFSTEDILDEDAFWRSLVLNVDSAKVNYWCSRAPRGRRVGLDYPFELTKISTIGSQRLVRLRCVFCRLCQHQ